MVEQRFKLKKNYFAMRENENIPNYSASVDAATGKKK